MKTLPTERLPSINHAIAYGRKSFDDPDERTSSVADQELFAHGYAQRHGMEVIAFYGDDGISDATMERPGLQRLLSSSPVTGCAS